MKSKLFIAIAAGIAGAIATVVATQVVGKILGQTPTTIPHIIFESADLQNKIAALSLGEKQISAGQETLPPLFYVFKYSNAGTVVGKERWFKSPPTSNVWIYILILANRRQNAVANVDIGIKIKSKHDFVGVMAGAGDGCFRIEPQECLSTKTPTICKTNDGKFVVQLDCLEGQKAAGLVVGVHSQNRPSIDDFDINIRSDSEIFSRATPAELKQAAAKK